MKKKKKGSTHQICLFYICKEQNVVIRVWSTFQAISNSWQDLLRMNTFTFPGTGDLECSDGEKCMGCCGMNKPLHNAWGCLREMERVTLEKKKHSVVAAAFLQTSF